VNKTFFVVVLNRPLKSTASKKLVFLESVLSRNRVNHRFFLKAKVTVIVWHSIETLKKTLATIAVSLNWEAPSYHQTLLVDLEKKTPFTLHHFFFLKCISSLRQFFLQNNACHVCINFVETNDFLSLLKCYIF